MRTRLIATACRYCGEENQVRKHGKAYSTKIQRYFCHGCKKTFQAKYIYQTKGDDMPVEVNDAMAPAVVE